MKTLKNIALVIGLMALFASCQTKTDVKQALSNLETRKEIMDTIARNSDMSKEMMVTLMNSPNGIMLMMENHGTMMKMMQDNPAMMQKMMSDMMEKCKSDTIMMSTMCKTMMDSKEMMGMMDKMKSEKKDMKGKKSMKGMKM